MYFSWDGRPDDYVTIINVFRNPRRYRRQVPFAHVGRPAASLSVGQISNSRKIERRMGSSCVQKSALWILLADHPHRHVQPSHPISMLFDETMYNSSPRMLKAVCVEPLFVKTTQVTSYFYLIYIRRSASWRFVSASALYLGADSVDTRNAMVTIGWWQGHGARISSAKPSE